MDELGVRVGAPRSFGGEALVIGAGDRVDAQ